MTEILYIEEEDLTAVRSFVFSFRKMNSILDWGKRATQPEGHPDPFLPAGLLDRENENSSRGTLGVQVFNMDFMSFRCMYIIRALQG